MGIMGHTPSHRPDWRRDHTPFTRHDGQRGPIKSVINSPPKFKPSTAINIKMDAWIFTPSRRKKWIWPQQTSTYLIISKFTVLQIVVLETPNTGICVVEGILANTVWKALLRNQSDRVEAKEIRSEKIWAGWNGRHLQILRGQVWDTQDL